MLRSSLRSNNGCLRCRQRRIKCDEKKPDCDRCSRWKLECQWPEEQKSNGSANHESTKAYLAMQQDKLPHLKCYQDGTLTNGHENFASDTQKRLVFSAIEFVGKYASYGIGRGLENLSFCKTLVLQNPWSRTALSAFTASAICRWDERFQTVAFNQYQAAVIQLRFDVSSRVVHENDVRFITSVFFLGLMEYFAHGRAKAALNHLSMVASKAVTLRQELRNTLQEASSRWIIAMTNIALGLCGNFFFLEPRISLIFKDNWENLDAFFLDCVQPLAEEYQIGTKEASLRNAILLRMNRLIYEPADSSNVNEVLHRITLMEAYVRSSEPVTTQQSSSSSMTLGWLADIAAMKVTAAVLARSDICSHDHQLRNLMKQWRRYNSDYLQTLNQQLPHTQEMLPLTRLSMVNQAGIAMYYVPLLCAVDDLDWFEELVSVYDSLELIIDDDLAGKIQRLIVTIRHRKKTARCTLEIDDYCHSRHDGIDALQHPEGMLW